MNYLSSNDNIPLPTSGWRSRRLGLFCLPEETKADRSARITSTNYQPPVPSVYDFEQISPNNDMLQLDE